MALLSHEVRAMQKTILVVEDYPDMLALMRYLLEDYGYRVLEATNGQEALDILRKMIPDLILMDLSMPVMDGITATKQIRNSKNNSRTPIIAVTADGHSRYNEAISAGCNGLIAKPIDFDSLEPAILMHLSA